MGAAQSSDPSACCCKGDDSVVNVPDTLDAEGLGFTYSSTRESTIPTQLHVQDSRGEVIEVLKASHGAGTNDAQAMDLQRSESASEEQNRESMLHGQVGLCIDHFDNDTGIVSYLSPDVQPASGQHQNNDDTSGTGVAPPCSPHVQPVSNQHQVNVDVVPDAHDNGNVKYGHFRTRANSWKHLPQRKRGIQLSELWDFHKREKNWIQSLRWQCSRCHRPSEDDTWSGCLCSSGAEGEKLMRNLYEVDEKMIKPICSPHEVSYVEFLRFGEGGNAEGVEVDSFVSHWWGGEFDKFLTTLSGFAHGNSRVLGVKRTQTSKSWSFWICAFCNNQFAIEHAMGEGGDITESSFATALQAKHCNSVVAVLDTHGIIYSRIWCAFELFYVKKMVPKLNEHAPHIALANEHGVISHGDGSLKDVLKCVKLIEGIKTADAEASVESDKTLIMQLMEREKTSNEDLDHILRSLSWEGVMACKQRQHIVLALLAGSTSPSLAYAAIKILSHIEADDLKKDALTVLRTLIFMLLFVTGIFLLSVFRGFPRLVNHAVDDRTSNELRAFSDRFTFHPKNLRLVVLYAFANHTSRYQWKVERKLWFAWFCLAVPQFVVAVIMFEFSGESLFTIDIVILLVCGMFIFLGALYKRMRELRCLRRASHMLEDGFFLC